MGEQLFYYHPDHLGSTGYVTRENGEVHEHIQYFPFGETWVQQGGNTEKSPYLFTAKELDEETGLYYFGARYYDPRTSVWQSADPILEKYLPTGNKERDEQLPGMGGVFKSPNLALYTYSHLNPVKLSDPDGNETVEINLVFIGGTIGTDDASGQPFWKGRIGLTGLGANFYSEYNFAPPEQVGNVGSYSGFDRGAESEGANVSAGVSAGIGLASFDLKLAEWSDQFVSVEKADGGTDYSRNQGDLKFLTGDFSIGFSDDHDIQASEKKGNRPSVGINISLDANYEAGSLIPWSNIFNDGEPYE